MSEQKLTHFDKDGQAHMVDISAKDATDRVAMAECFVRMAPETLALVESGTAKKGDVWGSRGLRGSWGRRKPPI